MHNMLLDFRVILFVYLAGTYVTTAGVKFFHGNFDWVRDVDQGVTVAFWPFAVPLIVMCNGHRWIRDVTPTLEQFKQNRRAKKLAKIALSEKLSGPPVDSLAEKFRY